MDISVVVCTHDRSELLRGVLADLAAQTGMERWRWEIIVVDNRSRDATPAVVRAASASCRVPMRYLFEGELGKSCALNAGVAAAAGRILAFTDDDVRLAPGWLSGLVEVMERFGCDGAGGPVVPVWERAPPGWVATDGPYRMHAAIVEFRHGDEPIVLEAAPLGANSAYRRDAFERFGPFRTDLGHVGRKPLPCEDTEFARRVMRGGGELRYAPGATVFHPVEPARLRRRYFLDWYAARGRAELSEEMPADVVWYADIPRHLIRRLAASAARWLFSVGRARRFFHKLQTWKAAGAILEARATRGSARS
jgi:glycosyltransferase involved in cell wall biosynthesis